MLRDGPLALAYYSFSNTSIKSFKPDSFLVSQLLTANYPFLITSPMYKQNPFHFIRFGCKHTFYNDFNN